MIISTRKAHWLGLVSGLALMGGMALQARAISPVSIHDAASAGPVPVLAYSTYLGDTRDEVALAIAVDASGNSYVTGYAGPWSLTDPTLTTEAFVMKLDSAGRLVYSVYLGGSDSDSGHAIAVDSAGNAYVTGSTYSRDFPRMSDLSPSPPGAPGQPYYSDLFVAKLDSGGSLVYSAVIGGSASDEGLAIAVDDQGYAYVAGSTSSPNFPVVEALQPFLGGLSDGFVAKLAPSGSALVFSTYLGGTFDDRVTLGGLVMDPAGSLHLVGDTSSPDFPIVNAVPSPSPSSGDCFVAKLAPTGSSLIYSTYFGGSGQDVLRGVAADRAGYTYVTGYTGSSDFPVVNAFQAVLGGDDEYDFDAFVTKLDPLGAIVYSTYLGGSWIETAQGIAVDSSGSVFVVGETASDDFPLRVPIQSDCQYDGNAPWHPCQVAFVAKLTPQGSGLVYSTYLGGNDLANPLPYGDREAALGVAVDSTGNAYVTGVTPAPDFPVANAFQPTFGGGRVDAFVAKLALSHPPVCDTATASPARLWPPNGGFASVAIVGVTDPEGGPVEIEVASIFQDEPLAGAGSADATGVGTPAARVRATRAGGADGRVYRIAFEARDLAGASCAGVVEVCVPHDRRPDAVCEDGGALVDSTRP